MRSLKKLDNDESVAVTTNSVKFNGTAFWFNGIEYDVSDIDENVNAINDCHQIGNHIIIQGHVGPKNNIYLVFNTETEIFEKKIIGCNLVWHSNDINTILYSFWNDICDYEGAVIHNVSIPETSQIDNIIFIDAFNAIEVTILNADGTLHQINYEIEEIKQ